MNPDGAGDAGTAAQAGTALVKAAAARRTTGVEITRLRTERGMTSAGLARRAGMPEAAVLRFERGNAVLVDLWQVHCLAEALGVTAGELVDAGRSVWPSDATARDRRAGPGQRSVFVLATVTGERTETPETGFRLIRWDPTTIGTHWEPASTGPHTNPEADPDPDPDSEAGPGTRPATSPPAITSAVLSWASLRMGGATYIAGPASDLLGSRSWYVGVMGWRPAPTTPDSATPDPATPDPRMPKREGEQR